jgi:4-hydroxy-tetrahydrodipicolinate reductase
MAAMKPQLMVNSCTGKMGQAVAEAALRAGIEIVPYTLCGPGETRPVSVQGIDIELLDPSRRDEVLPKLKAQYPRLMMVDYTLPDAIHSMVDFYVKHQTPFVMGTTGGDRAKIAAQVTLRDPAPVVDILCPDTSA